ncbi:PPOX class F420-dependent oxidoreductase [Haloterrigena alkaliphila]|uniref:PPOX class F420-dependent oxidoreductase n=1 Tax=Haloterrigena alkaliphila TaxID=2816475 RepID=A0A8A2VEM1_9EURY|nr:PPOX class F420-dependent oxidoreductase [Haloterrigena alkaliphila]QSW99160.1 PPOX class F420-dependent oxidoreductase [Haloterrigena alkaliphila]
METLPDETLDLFEKPAKATIASFLPSGHPQVTPVWADYDGTHLLVATNKGTRKHENVQHDPRVTVTIIDPDDYYRYVEVRGEVEKMPEEGALEFTDQQAQRYWGVDEYPYDRELPRVLLHISPERVVSKSLGSPERNHS